MEEEKRGDRSFFLEGEEILDRLLSLLSQWEKGVSPSLLSKIIEELFRELHTLKGTAGSHGFAEISDLCHLMERLIALARGRIEALDEGFRSLILDGVNVLSRMFEGASKGKVVEEGDLPQRISAKIKKLKKIKPNTSSLSQIDERIISPLTEGERIRLSTELSRGRLLFRARYEFPQKRLRSFLTLVEEKVVSPLVKIALVPSALTGGRMAMELFLSAPSEYSVEKLAKELSLGGKAPSELLPLIPGKREPIFRGAPRTIRVEIARLDELLNRLGELMVEKEKLRDRFSALIKKVGFTQEVREMEQVLLRLERRVSSLFDQMVTARMIPISQIFAKLKRQAGAIASQLNKRVEVAIKGGETEVDGVLIERLSDPLIHLIRNAIDHGIEEGEERRKRGKPERGRITLSAEPKGGKIIIEVADDGRGIDLAQVLRRAREQGLVLPGEKLSRERTLSLIFEPGFSTRTRMTEISGMGIGMDVVKERIEELGGMVEVDTKKGSGTRVRVVIPVTLANFKVLLSQVDQFTFAFPLSAVVRGTRLNGSGMMRKKGGFHYPYQGREIPVFSLREELLRKKGEEGRFLVIIEEWGKRMGFLVDSLIGQREVVVRPLPSLLSQIPGIVGVAESGEERLALLLDLSFFAEKV